MVYEDYIYSFVIEGIFIIAYRNMPPNLYNYYTFPDCTWRNFGFSMEIF